jgi:hypothetical protein
MLTSRAQRLLGMRLAPTSSPADVLEHTIMVAPDTITSLNGRSRSTRASSTSSRSDENDTSINIEKQASSSLPNETTPGHSFQRGQEQQQLLKDKTTDGDPAPTFPETVSSLLSIIDLPCPCPCPCPCCVYRLL